MVKRLPSEKQTNPWRRKWAWLWVFGIPGGLALLALTSPGSLDHLPRLCLWSRLLRGPCPACGTLHALCAVVHGDLGGAVQFNRNVVILAPLLLWIWFHELGALWRTRGRELRARSS
jgi:hypothetical protein